MMYIDISDTERIALNAASAYGAELASCALSASKIVTSDGIGSVDTPVYIDGDGYVSQLTANVGNSARPIYLDGGSIVPLDGTIGSSANPVFINSGTITALNGSIGADVQPVYFNNGIITPGIAYSAASVASANSAAVADRFNVGAVGNLNNPVYFNADGEPVAATAYSAATVASAYSAGLAESTLSAVYAEKITTSEGIGGENAPIYIDKDGNILPAIAYSAASVGFASNADMANRFSEGAVGNNTTFVYLNADGEPTETTANVGTATRLMYLKDGALKASSTTVGSSAQAVYLKSGVVTALEGNIGAFGQPIFIENGEMKPAMAFSAASVGKAASAETAERLNGATGNLNTPVYFNADGEPVAATAYSAASVKFADSAASANIAETATYAEKIGTQIAIGGANQPVYITSTGQIQPATAYSAASVAYAATARQAEGFAAGATGNNTTFIYLNADGEPVASNATIGLSDRPVYLDNGVVKASSANIGDSGRPIYMENGTLKEISATIGSSESPVFINNGIITSATAYSAASVAFAENAKQAEGFAVGATGNNINFIYLNADGEPTASNADIGSSSTFVYFEEGIVKASSATIGSSATPVYLNNGEITELTSTLGSENQPVYLREGVITSALAYSAASVAHAERAGATDTFSGGAVGNIEQPIYFNADGEPVAATAYSAASVALADSANSAVYADSARSAEKIATADAIGSTSQPIYIDKNGNISAAIAYSAASVAYAATAKQAEGFAVGATGNNVNFIYLNADGQPTASNADIGTGINPVYVEEGILKASSSIVGSSSIPVYLNSGELTAFNSTIGSENNPVYINNGEITAATAYSAASVASAKNAEKAGAMSVGAVGNVNQPIYFNSDGEPIAATAYSAASVEFARSAAAFGFVAGGENQPIYVNSDGVPTEITADVGDAATPMYLKEGAFTALSATVGSSTRFTYLQNGTITASQASLGSGASFLYLNNGEFSVSETDIGSSATPVYLKEGVVTASPFTLGTEVSSSSTSAQIPSAKDVYDAIIDSFALNDAMVFKGSVSSFEAVIAESQSAGYTYRVAVAGDYAGQYAEVGDLLIACADVEGGTMAAAANSSWIVAQTNVDGALFMGHDESAIGAANKIIYFVDRQPVESEITIGSYTTPVYLKDGAITAINTADLMAGCDGDGDTITEKYVEVAGDTMTGDLIVQADIVCTGTIYGSTVYGGVSNDYAEFRQALQGELLPGFVVCGNDNGELMLTNQHMSHFEGVVSDTYGFAIGETEKCKVPLAVAGRVLVYFEGNRDDYHTGDVVCASETGRVEKMTREEAMWYPDRIVGTVSEIPQYEEWGDAKVKVNNRIWIKVR